MNAVVILTPYLTEETADDLLAAAAHKPNAEIAKLLARRFPRPDLPTQVQAIASALPTEQLVPEPVGTPTEQPSPGIVETPPDQLAVQPVGTLAMPLAARPIEAPVPRAKLFPLSPGRFALQFTIGQRTHDNLRYAQALASH